MNISELQSNRNGILLVCNDFVYRKHSEPRGKDTIYWRCNVTNCKGRLKTDIRHRNPVESGIHFHDINQEYVDVKRARTEMRHAVEENPHVAAMQVSY